MRQAFEWMRPLLAFVSVQRFRRRKIATDDELSEFLATRSAYIAQTALFGYLKTRMGTQFRDYFEDAEYSGVIHKSAINLYASCLSDLTIFSVGLVAEATYSDDDELWAFAKNLFQLALYKGVADNDRFLIPPDAASEFEIRARNVVWSGISKGERAFSKSVDDLVRFAPVVDEFKELDRAIVRNSIRFRWRDVREQLRRRMSPEEFGI